MPKKKATETPIRLRPSGWAQWAQCPGSVAAQIGLPESVSLYADEGTTAHHVLERRFHVRDEEFDRWPEIGLTHCIPGKDDGQGDRIVEITREMCDHANDVRAYVGQRLFELDIEGYDTALHTEREFDIGVPLALPDHVQMTGTADLVIVARNSKKHVAHIEVIDYKYGRGHAVEVGTEEAPNGQLMLYLIGAIAATTRAPLQESDDDEGATPEATTFRITVFQPRAPHKDGARRSLDLRFVHVEMFLKRALDAAFAAIEPGAPRIPSEAACRWCRAQPTCGAVHSHLRNEVLGSDKPGNLKADKEKLLRDPKDLTPEELIRVIEITPFVTSFCKAVASHVEGLLAGGSAPELIRESYKLAPGESRRRWRFDEEATQKALQAIKWVDPATGKPVGLKKRDLYVESLRSPAQVEALIKPLIKEKLVTATHLDALHRLVEKPTGALKLVRVDRPGPDAIEAMFGDVPEEPKT